jgi:SAM-dependent methyltransferase
MNVQNIYRGLGRKFRDKRALWLSKQFVDCSSVLDIGGHYRWWTDRGWTPARLTLLNLEAFRGRLMPGAWHIQANALAVPLRDQSFDLAMSNSVIEHVPDQAKFAAEMMRVGKRLYCQTPSEWFPVEPHYLGLFVHWLPKRFFTHSVHRYLIRFTGSLRNQTQRRRPNSKRTFISSA